MAESENNKIVSQNSEPKEPNNLFSLLSRFQLRFPFQNPKNKAESTVPEPLNPAEKESENGTQRPNVVTFPNYPLQTTTPLESEFQESVGTSHNPVIIWQVYALGAFIVLKSIWSRWKESNERAKKPSTDDEQSPDENQSTAGDDE